MKVEGASSLTCEVAIATKSKKKILIRKEIRTDDEMRG